MNEDDVLDRSLSPDVENAVDHNKAPEIEVPVTPPRTAPSKKNNSSSSDALKAAGIAAGVGLAAGAIAYGVNEKMKDKDIDDDYKYEYESSNEDMDTLYTEVDGNEINAFSGGDAE